MRLKKIALMNIRSYENHEIEFPEGSTLLSGDIGAGKTSILLAIEFALFGLQPGQRGSSLLRNGKTEGGAKIELEIDEKEVIIERTLKKGKTISQDYCAITIDQQKQEISVTELKSRVLDLLNYPKEFAKKQNLLYKFTVYTPQEEMKQIILQDPATRINTLRHVFGIDKYKKILENASIVTSKLREEKRLKQGMVATLDQDKEQVLSKEEELETKRYNLTSVEKELFLKAESRKKIQEEKDEISKKIEEKNKLKIETEKTKILFETKKDLVMNNSKVIQRIEDETKEFEEIKFDENEGDRLTQEVILIKNKKQELNEENLNITSQISSFTLKNQEAESLKNKISSMDMCPTCLQDVDSVYKSNVKNKTENDISSNVRKIEELTLKKRKISEELSKVEFEISKKEERVSELRVLKVKIESLNDKKSRIDEIRKANLTLDKDMELLNQHMESLKNSVFDLSIYDNAFQEKSDQYDNAFREERLAEIKVAELTREIGVFSSQIEELKGKIKRIEEIKEQLIYLSNLENWLSTKFIPVISNIEKNVMVKLKSEFSMLFSEWFAMLVPESFNVRLDDDFTPLIEQHDYELDYAYLSGGERTAIALAYRLALNQVINSLLSKIKTRDLVILDEPTDGFSEQQLDKMREVLDQFNIGQLIIVSHEQKIEGFVENVIRLRKENGVSGKD